VSCLIRSHLLHVRVELGVEPGGREVLLGEVRKTFTVEGVLEVLEGQGVVEDVGCAARMLAMGTGEEKGAREHTIGNCRSLPLDDRSCRDDARNGDESRADVRKLHDGDECAENRRQSD
jgi:hypothetical protein